MHKPIHRTGAIHVTKLRLFASQQRNYLRAYLYFCYGLRPPMMGLEEVDQMGLMTAQRLMKEI